MTTTYFKLLSDIRPGKNYKLITFNHGIRMSDIQLGRTDSKNIKDITILGKLLEIRQYGRPYDPDISLCFQMENSDILLFDPSFGSTEAYIEYEFDTEEKSRGRIQERTRALAIEIEGNDWALRPENVVATQGIDTSNFVRV